MTARVQTGKSLDLQGGFRDIDRKKCGWRQVWIWCGAVCIGEGISTGGRLTRTAGVAGFTDIDRK